MYQNVRLTKAERIAIIAWARALESGTHQQGKSYLVQPGLRGEQTSERKYCCLGVLCELDPRLTNRGFDFVLKEQIDSYGVYESFSVYPPSVTIAGVPWHILDLTLRQNFGTGFAGLNDGWKLSFSAIAVLLRHVVFQSELIPDGSPLIDRAVHLVPDTGPKE